MTLYTNLNWAANDKKHFDYVSGYAESLNAEINITFRF